MGLSDGRKSFPIGLAVLIPECDSQPPSQPPSHVAVAITLNAKASSLKTENHYKVLLVGQSSLFWTFTETVFLMILWMFLNMLYIFVIIVYFNLYATM